MVEVSIVIPTKNRPQLLNRAINSILKQTYEDWELFIINDAETKATINSSDSRIQIINNKNNKNCPAFLTELSKISRRSDSEISQILSQSLNYHTKICSQVCDRNDS